MLANESVSVQPLDLPPILDAQVAKVLIEL
jgi:hypothetical protein